MTKTKKYSDSKGVFSEKETKRMYKVPVEGTESMYKVPVEGTESMYKVPVDGRTANDPERKKKRVMV